MSRKFSLAFLIVTSLCIALLLLCSSCCLFGRKKEKGVAVTQVKIVTTGEATDKPAFESDELDVKIETVNGSLNWTRGLVEAEGTGYPPADVVNEHQARTLAFDAAYADAAAKLLAVAQGIQVTATTTVEKHMITSQTIELEIKGIVKGARELSRHYRNDKDGKEAIIRIGIYLDDVVKTIPESDLSIGDVDLYGWDVKRDATLYPIVGNDRILEEIIRNSESLHEIEQKLDPMRKESAAENKELHEKIEKLNQEIQELKKIETRVENLLTDYTGIVINAACSNIKPNAKPTIYYKDGDETRLFYGINDGREKKQPVYACFVKTLTNADNHPRLKQTPYVANAMALSEEKCSFVISAEDAKVIEKINKERHLLNKCKVVIIY